MDTTDALSRSRCRERQLNKVSKSEGISKVERAYHFYRATRMHSADYAMARCLSVRLSHTGIVSKGLYISSKNFRHRVAPPF